jgi:hypothetical protein
MTNFLQNIDIYMIPSFLIIKYLHGGITWSAQRFQFCDYERNSIDLGEIDGIGNREFGYEGTCLLLSCAIWVSGDLFAWYWFRVWNS